MNKIEQIESLMQQLNHLKSSPDAFIYDYFENVKREVDLRREILKQEIDKCSDQMIEQIEKSRSDCLNLSAKIEDISAEMDTLTQELNQLRGRFNSMDSFEPDSKKSKFTGPLNETSLEEIERELVELERKFEQRMQAYKSSMLQNKAYSFECNEKNFGEEFGKIIQREVGGK